MTDIEENIIVDFYESWKTLNPELIIKHLSADFEYDSQWTMETLDSNHYAQYLREKFTTLAKSNQMPQVEIVADTLGKFPQMLKLEQNGKSVFYRIRLKEDKVIKGDLCMF